MFIFFNCVRNKISPCLFITSLIDRARPAVAVTAPDPALLAATVIAVEMTAVTTAVGMTAAMIVAMTVVEMTVAETTVVTTVTAEMTVMIATVVEAKTVERTARNAVEAMTVERTARSAVVETTAERTVEEKAVVIAVRKVLPTESHRLLPVDAARPALLVNVEDRSLRSAPSRLMLVKKKQSMSFLNINRLDIHISLGKQRQK